MSETHPLPPEKSPRGLLYGIAAIVLIGLVATGFYLKKEDGAADSSHPQVTTPESNPSVLPSSTASDGASAQTTTAPDLTVDAAGLSKAVVTIETPKGKIKFRFYSKDAPNTAARLVQLIQSGFYNGLTFHRVEPGFVIQGGDPSGNGTGGSGTKLKAEFNSRKHIMGTVAMARAQDPDSADSQFYIALSEIPHLDGSYTVVGQVSEGMDIVSSIQVGDKMTKVSVE
ncbi:MAG: peptidylprolyl isomerase [Cryobacterium sp.]|nr:peptidylprolyl isomerase [Oligoflexia bacterium]